MPTIDAIPAAALAALLSAAATYALVRRGRGGVPDERGDHAGTAGEHRLRADLALVQTTLQDYIHQREAAEEELRSSEERYRLLADNASDIICLLDADGALTYVSPAVERTLGFAPDEVVAAGAAARLVHPDDHARLQSESAPAIHQGVDTTVLFRARRTDGDWRWLSGSIRPFVTGDGRPHGYCGVLRDVTDWKRDSDALAESESKYRMLAESIDDVVSLHDLTGVALYYSASLETTMGYTPAELVGRDARDTAHPDDLPRLGDAMRRAAVGGHPLVEWRCRRHDGGYVWLETRTTLVRGSDGAPHRLLCVSRNVERRKRAELALQESEERYRSLIVRAAYGIYRSTPDGRFLDVNPALVAMLGYESADELLAVDITADVYRDPAERERVLRAVMSSEVASWTVVHWRRRDGTPITVRLSPRAVRDDSGDVVALEGIAEDITDRYRQDELVRRSERMASLGHTLAGVAHELNNPLAAVIGFAQLLIRGGTMSGDDRSALETISHEASRAGKIVKDLLAVSRRQDEPGREEVAINDVVRYILATQRYAMETRGIRTDAELDPALPVVLADRSQIEQVLLNLVVNARQAIEIAIDPVAGRTVPRRPPRIIVRSRSEGARVVLEVEDSGPGIPAADLQRIWDPFWTSKPEGEGTGLGLSVVHGIVTAHGGRIDVESDVGVGTRFTIRLPVSGADPGAMAAAAALPGNSLRATDSSGSGSNGGARSSGSGVDAPHALPDESRGPLDILLVADDAAARDHLERFFAGRGHAVVAAADAAHALRLASQSSFDVVVCDLRDAKSDEAGMVRRLRQLPTTAAARYIVSSPDASDTTGMADVEALRRAVEGA